MVIITLVVMEVMVAELYFSKFMAILAEQKKYHPMEGMVVLLKEEVLLGVGKQGMMVPVVRALEVLLLFKILILFLQVFN